MANKTERDAAVESIENNTAIVLDGRDSLRRLWLFLRALERRQLIGQGDAKVAQDDLEKALRALDVAQSVLGERRQNPLGGAGG
jgi:hypothetical protein